ncbi:MAG TPA: HoxN/HupN/NixA family nickel/cobalt transporter [Caulobacteraceae bacterium]|nr:HoxN/HupN/NixA family nickel/cobalt transporter [Caulobacteraceae bacterium]
MRQALGSGAGGRIAAVYAGLIGFNLAMWIWALAAFAGRPALLATALLAYAFGLRHAVDADHIAAIDNVTRKLMNAGQRPVGVGLFFACGHSAVVGLAAAAALGAAQHLDLDRLKAVGGLASTLVSGLFLVFAAAMNLIVLDGVCKALGRFRRTGAYAGEDVERLLAGRGLAARILRPAFGLISHSWHMFPLGVLFGLGFDTASEIVLLGLSQAEAAKGLPLGTLMVFPALFAAGMTLIDTSDGVLMLGAYDWALVRPARRLYYNLVVTALAVVVAVLIGGIELLGVVRDQLGLTGGVWSAVQALGGDFSGLGFAVVGLFAAAWTGSAIFARLRGEAAPD